jgi:hypothetical protein
MWTRILASFSGIGKPGRCKMMDPAGDGIRRKSTIPSAVPRHELLRKVFLLGGQCCRCQSFNLGIQRGLYGHPSAPCLKFVLCPGSAKLSLQGTNVVPSRQPESCVAVLCRSPRTTNTNKARPFTQPGSRFKGRASSRSDFNTIASKSHTPPDVVQSTNCAALLARECCALH